MSSSSTSTSSSSLDLVDVAVNLTDGVFRGRDHAGRRRHDDDFDLVLQRASESGVRHMIVTGTSLSQCIEAVALCRTCVTPTRLFCTVGVHPAHCNEFVHSPCAHHDDDDNSDHDGCDDKGHGDVGDGEHAAELRLARLQRLVEDNRDVVVGIGELGLDDAELTCCSREVQERYLRAQLRRLAPLQLPLLLHSRDCGMRLVSVLREELPALWPHARGVVHSFNGSAEEQAALLRMGFYLSLNASAFRTEALARQVMHIPLDRLLLESDAPWCDARARDFGYRYVHTHYPTRKRDRFQRGCCVERRNEPCCLVQVLEMYVGCAHAQQCAWCAHMTWQASKEYVAAAVRANVHALFRI